MEKYYKVEQISKSLQVHWQTVLNYIKAGKLQALKLGKGYRVSETDLNKFINQLKRQIK